MSCMNLFPISPMLCEAFDISKLSSFDFSEYLLEVKWDGSRCLAFSCGDETKLHNRRFIDITRRYPEIKIQLKDGITEAIFDGEVISMLNGVPDFNALQHREHLESDDKIERAMQIYKVSYVIFDILYVDGKDITSLPLIERKKILKETLVETENVFISDYILKEGKKYFEACVQKGLEGIIAKDIHSPYLVSKRSKYWLKIKKEDTIDTVIVGTTEGEGYRSRYFGALVLGVYRNAELRYIAKAGSGLKMKDLKLLMEVLKLVPTLDKSPLIEVPAKLRREKVKWYKPILVAELKFMEMTRDKKLRHPRFLRLRTDKFAEECVLNG